MTSRPPNIPLCGLSFRGDWTPRNRIYFRQCIQEKDEEKYFYSQKKKWKGKQYSYGIGKNRRKYMVYKYVSSSESDECNSSEMYERDIRSNIANEPDSSDEYDDSHSKEIVKIDEYKSHSESEENHTSDEPNSEDEQEGRMKIDEYKSHSKPAENHSSDELNSEDEQEGRAKVDDYESRSESGEAYMSDELNSADEQENHVHHKHSAVKFKKYKRESSDDESSDEWEINSSDKSSSSDSYDSKDSSDDNEVVAKEKKYQKSKKRSKKNLTSKNLKSPIRSEYEKNVLKNREENIALLRSLKVYEAKENFTDAVKTLKPQKTQKENIKRCFTEDSDGLVVRRQSVRQKSFLKKKDETFACSQSPNELSFEKVLKKGSEYYDFISEGSGTKHTIPHLLDNDFASHFEKMTVYGECNVSGGSISSMDVHGSQENIIICIGNSTGEIIFLHMNSENDFCAFQLHLEKVNCLKFNPYFPNVLISSSDDGTVCSGDFEKKIFRQMFKAERCNHFDFLSPTSYLVAHGVGYVSILDMRMRSKRNALEKRHLCHEDVVKTVNLHPSKNNYFISAHQNGAVRLWDLRKLQNEPVIETCCSSGKLKSSFFSPVAGNSVLVTMSNTICLLDSSSLSHEFKLKKSMEYKIVCDYQATWLPNSEDSFVVGSNLNPRRIEIFDDKLCNSFSFRNDSFKKVTLINMFHPSLPLLVGAAAKRSIHLFSESE